MKRTFTKDPVWLLLGLDRNGLKLYCIDTEQWIARRHLKIIQDQIEWGTPPFHDDIRVWIEKRETNHLFAISMIDKDSLSVIFTLDEMEFLGYDPEIIETIRKFRAEKRTEKEQRVT